MAEDWAADVRKYAPGADDNVIAGIVRYCGIALRSRDSSLVSFGDPAETARVRDNFCRKKLGLTESDAEVDAVVVRVRERMGGDGTRNRVTVYYLLAEAFGKFGLFTSGAVAAAPAGAPLATAAMPAAAMPAHAPRAPFRPAERLADADTLGPGLTALLGCGGLGLIVLVAATAASLYGSRNGEPVAVDPPPTFTAAPAAVAAPAIPTGAGVVAQEEAGRPKVSVYFDTGKSDVSPDFAAAAGPIKAWLDGHAGARLAVSGYNDPTGNAALNAELSKNRAKSVAAALAGLGVPATVIDLEKPPETTDTGTDAAQARRVDIVVKDAA